MSIAGTAWEMGADVRRWIEEARDGSDEALGHLLQVCRPYLLMTANHQLGPDLRAKVGGSDLVQETFLEAQRDFAGFPGRTEDELRAWLCRILLNNMANVRRHYRQTGKRQVSREVGLAELPRQQLTNGVTDTRDSPSAWAVAREEDEALTRALGQLPEEYRQAIQWRSYERCSFEEVGRRLGRSPEAARKLWARGVERLQQILEPPHEPG